MMTASEDTCNIMMVRIAYLTSSTHLASQQEVIVIGNVTKQFDGAELPGRNSTSSGRKLNNQSEIDCSLNAMKIVKHIFQLRYVQHIVQLQ